MTATEELRRMLDERDVEHSDFASAYRLSTRWQDSSRRVIEHQLRKDNDIGDMGIVRNLTPEQAIEATLGRGTCKLDDFADVPFSVDYEIEGYDMDSGRDYATLAECSACGAYIIVPPEYHHVLTCDGDEVYQPYRFCPNCGRKVVNT